MIKINRYKKKAKYGFLQVKKAYFLLKALEQMKPWLLMEKKETWKIKRLKKVEQGQRTKLLINLWSYNLKLAFLVSIVLVFIQLSKTVSVNFIKICNFSTELICKCKRPWLLG